MLFTPFGRVQTRDTANIDGSGLGLYLVKELVGAMGGEVWVESLANEGSTFSFDLPTSATITVPEDTQDNGDNPSADDTNRGR